MIAPNSPCAKRPSSPSLKRAVMGAPVAVHHASKRGRKRSDAPTRASASCGGSRTRRFRRKSSTEDESNEAILRFWSKSTWPWGSGTGDEGAFSKKGAEAMYFLWMALQTASASSSSFVQVELQTARKVSQPEPALGATRQSSW